MLFLILIIKLYFLGYFQYVWAKLIRDINEIKKGFQKLANSAIIQIICYTVLMICTVLKLTVFKSDGRNYNLKPLVMFFFNFINNIER